MIGEKYIGLDVHQATISVAVMDSKGKVVMESILETQAATILEFFAGLRGTLWVTFEEGTWAAWLYDLLKPHVAKLVVCNPRKNALLKHGNKSDKIDARKLADLLRLTLPASCHRCPPSSPSAALSPPVTPVPTGIPLDAFPPRSAAACARSWSDLAAARSALVLEIGAAPANPPPATRCHAPPQ